MKSNKTVKAIHRRGVKLIAILAGSLCLLGLLAGCGQAKSSSQATAENSTKTVEQSQGQEQKTSNTSLETNSAALSSTSAPAPQSSTSTSGSASNPASSSSTVSNSGSTNAQEEPGSANEAQIVNEAKAYFTSFTNEIETNSGLYGYNPWDNGNLMPKAYINSLSNTQVWDAYLQSKKNCNTQNINIPNCAVRYTSVYIGNNPLTKGQIRSILSQEIPYADISGITYDSSMPCYLVYTTQSLSPSQPFWYVNPYTGFAMNIYGEGANQPQTPVTKQNYIPALVRFFSVFMQTNHNYTWGSAWVNKVPNNAITTDFLQSNPAYQPNQGEVITNAMLNSAVEWMTQNAWAGPVAPYSLAEASQMIEQENWIGITDNSVGPLSISRIVQHGTMYYIYVKGDNNPWGGVNTQTGFTGNA